MLTSQEAPALNALAVRTPGTVRKAEKQRECRDGAN